EPLGRSPLAAPVRVDPGAHRLKASLDSGISREITIEVAAKQLVPARLELAPAPAPAPVSLAPPVQAPLVPANDTHPAPPAPSPITPDHSAQKTWGYVVGAAGLALSAVAVSHYLWNRNRYDEWRSRSNAYYVDPTDQHRESANSLGRSIPAASAVTVGLTIGAGVALGTGAVLLITSSPSSADSGAQARSTLVRLQGEF
ncbi:MAG TPA: hypothetical protein VEQ58_15330, partial [Polyangiaceae bacterium]|nr:hypothetical protein [Polyangiaceae bacterium]